MSGLRLASLFIYWTNGASDGDLHVTAVEPGRKSGKTLRVVRARMASTASTCDIALKMVTLTFAGFWSGASSKSRCLTNLYADSTVGRSPPRRLNPHIPQQESS
jgi:hypothetical protein